MWAFIIMNIIAFVVAGYDKYAAIHKKYRISEKSLILLAFFLGGIGLILGFLIFRHKTKHYKLFFSVLFITVAEYLFFIFISGNNDLLEQLRNMLEIPI